MQWQEGIANWGHVSKMAVFCQKQKKKKQPLCDYYFRFAVILWLAVIWSKYKRLVVCKIEKNITFISYIAIVVGKIAQQY